MPWDKGGNSWEKKNGGWVNREKAQRSEVEEGWNEEKHAEAGHKSFCA